MSVSAAQQEPPQRRDDAARDTKQPFVDYRDHGNYNATRQLRRQRREACRHADVRVNVSPDQHRGASS